MNCNKTYLLFFAFLLLSIMPAKAQLDGTFDNEELHGLVYDDEFSLDFRLHTSGYLALAMNRAKIKTYYRSTYYQLEVGTLKHFRESRNSGINIQGSTGRDYIFGKRNSLWLVRGGWGEKRYFSQKADKRGVAIGMSYLGGASLGILKPYYLNLRVSDGDGNFEIVSSGYSEEIHDEFLTVTNILGASGFKYGWSEISVMPGLHGKIAVHLDWGAYDELVKALEFGFMIDAYYKRVPLMITEDNSPVFINVFLALQFGKRW